MQTERNRSLTARIPWKDYLPYLCRLLLVGCGRDSAPSADQSKAAQPTAVPVARAEENVGTVLRAAPNPVPAGNAPAKTTIIWQTGSDAEAEIFYFDGDTETLFATGSKGSKEADFIKPGSNEFRMYNKGEKKLVTQLLVTMP